MSPHLIQYEKSMGQYQIDFYLQVNSISLNCNIMLSYFQWNNWIQNDYVLLICFFIDRLILGRVKISFCSHSSVISMGLYSNYRHFLYSFGIACIDGLWISLKIRFQVSSPCRYFHSSVSFDWLYHFQYIRFTFSRTMLQSCSLLFASRK